MPRALDLDLPRILGRLDGVSRYEYGQTRSSQNRILDGALDMRGRGAPTPITRN